jgi:hypothetical protein
MTPNVTGRFSPTELKRPATAGLAARAAQILLEAVK